MDGTSDTYPPAPASLREELERSRSDLAVGRVRPVQDVLAEVRERATHRLAQKRQAGRDEQDDAG